MSATTTVEARPRPGKADRTEQAVQLMSGQDTGPAVETHTSLDNVFFWTYTEEPHRTRRQAIIKAHPEVTKLCGPEPLTKYLVLLVVSLQLFCAYQLRDSAVLSWRFLLTSYLIG